MTSRDFAYWLQGYFEVSNPTQIGPQETKAIKAHLNLVFKHEIDPSMGDQKHQDELNEIHNQSISVPPVPSRPPFNDPNELMRC